MDKEPTVEVESVIHEGKKQYYAVVVIDTVRHVSGTIYPTAWLAKLDGYSLRNKLMEERGKK